MNELVAVKRDARRKTQRALAANDHVVSMIQFRNRNPVREYEGPVSSRTTWQHVEAGRVLTTSDDVFVRMAQPRVTSTWGCRGAERDSMQKLEEHRP